MTDVDLLQLERELTSLALQGNGWPVLLERFAARAGLAVSLIGVHGEPLIPTLPGAPASIDPGEIATAFARGTAPHSFVVKERAGAVGIPVFAGSRRVGILAMPVWGGDAASEARRLELLETLRIAVAVEGVRRDTLQQARGENASQIVDELRYGSLRNPARVARAAAKFGVVLDRGHRGVVFHYRGPQRQSWATAVAWLPTPTRLSGDLAWTVVDDKISADDLRRTRLRMQGIVGDVPLRMSVGPVVQGSENTASSFRLAETSLGLLMDRGGAAIFFDELGGEQLMMELAPSQLQRFVARQIGPILNRDDLVLTLRAWFELDGSRGAIAERLFVHRNSVGYRLGLIRNQLGDDCLEPTRAHRLLSGLQAHDTVRAMEAFAALEREESRVDAVDAASG